VKVSVAGTGYVGLITGVGIASLGHDVTCVDVIPEKVEQINKGIAPIFEENLEKTLKNVLAKGKFKATLDMKQAVLDSDITFICVGTPSNKDGSMDVTYVNEVSQTIGEALKEKKGYHSVVVKSTVLPGTTEDVVAKTLEKASGKTAGKDFGVAMSPEFLREGKALEDFNNPDRIVIGTLDDKTADAVKALSPKKDVPVVVTNPKTAEMIKYASNSFLAAKISFANEIGNISKKIGIDSYKVMEAVGMDNRINPQFFKSGIGFGGSCFPKDVKALIDFAKSIDYDPEFLEEIIEVNANQVKLLMEFSEEAAGDLKDKTVAVLGLAFKPGTDDIRESPALAVIEKLLEKGAKIQTYDPEAMEETKKQFPDLTYTTSSKEAIDGSDLCLVITDWPEFKKLDFSGMNSKIVVDGRNIVENREGITYIGLCW